MSEDVDARVARRLHDMRSRRGSSLSSVARLVGISSAHLSRLENGDRQPSMGTLLQLARVYEVTVGELVEDSDDRSHHLFRAGDERGRSRGREGEYQVLTKARSNLLAVKVWLEPGQVTQEARHVGEEWIHVLDGPGHVHLGAEDVELAAGDSMHFDSSRPHRLRAPQDRVVELLVVSAAGTLPAHHPLPPRRQ